MFHKVIKEGKVVDVLDQLVFLKYQPRHDIMVLCPESEAQAFLSSDKDTIWHEATFYKVPVDGYDTVTLVEIDKHEYERLKMLNGRTPEEIIDSYTLMLISNGII